MTTANLLAIIVGLLILLAILWFMTRSRKLHPSRAAHRDDLQRQATGAQPDGTAQGRVTVSAGATTAQDNAPAAVPAHATDGHATTKDGHDNFAGVAADTDSRSSPGSGALAAGVAAAGAAIAGTGAGAGAGAGVATAPGGRADTGAAPSAGDPAAGGQPAASTPDAHHAGTFDGVQHGPGTMHSPDMDDLASADPALEGDFTVDTSDVTHDVREMMKILNLRDSEAQRLDLSTEEFQQLRRGETDGFDEARLDAIAERLRRMIR